LLTLILLCGAQFVVVLDQTIVNTALPSIQRALHFSVQDLQWVMFVNVPFALAAIVAGRRLLAQDQMTTTREHFDAAGAALVTAGLMLLVYGLVKAPDVGWGAGRTLAALGGAAALLILFAINEMRAAKPLAPLSILRVRGLAGANVVLAMASAGILAMFFFLSLYLQGILGYSPLKAVPKGRLEQATHATLCRCGRPSYA
jgi:hypothetical protein